MAPALWLFGKLMYPLPETLCRVWGSPALEVAVIVLLDKIDP